MTSDCIAALTGYSSRHITYIARRMGLPPRQMGPKVTYDQAEFAALWRAGVSLAEISVLYGRARSTLTWRAKQLGLPPRCSGWHPKMTLIQFRAGVAQEALIAAMTASAKETRAAMAERQRELAA